MSALHLIIAITIIIVTMIIAALIKSIDDNATSLEIEKKKIDQENEITLEALKSDSALIKINALLPQDLSFTEYANEHEIERGNSEFWQKRDIYHAGAEAYKQAVLHILTTGKAK